ncbi:U3 small nucleolar ribonucleoprotein complex, subunit Mpp10 [Fomes fomentarius]|nr:U3 small nucleolar ribonucleoprotein complex, subunit Mpp10 [Fomes fomentarius]
METQDVTKPTEELSLPEQFETLVKLIEEKPEALATGNEDLRKAALDATKYVYDLALRTEKDACSRVNDLLTSISPSYAPQTRSQAADSSRKRKRGSQSPPLPDKAAPLLKETPLTDLIVDGMSDEQIWAELELRAHNVCDILNYALDGPIPGRESGEEEEDESGDEEEEEHELKKMRQALIDEGFDPDELDDMGFDEDDDEDEEDSEDDEDGESDEDGTGDGEVELGELVEELRDPSDEDNEDGNDLEVGASSLLSGGKRTLKLKLRRRGHPVLDDGFFDLAAFNAEIEAAESKSVSKGRLSKDDEDEDDDEDDTELVDLFAPVDDTAAFDEEDIEQSGDLFYKDFFEPPVRIQAPKAKKRSKGAADEPPSSAGKVRFHEEVRVRKIKAKGKNLPLSTMFCEEDDDDDDDEYEDEEGVGSDEDDEEDDEDVDEDEEMLGQSLDDGEESGVDDRTGGDDVSMEDEEESGLAIMDRFKDDLFADEDKLQEQQGLSTYEKRMAALRDEIAALEAENVGKKDWTLMGEASSRSRPQNSLLEEDLEFERVMKSVPVITEEVVQSLEERIKAHILENQFDDVVRKRPVDDKPFLPSRFFELQDTKSKQSLADIYEDEYTAAQSGSGVGEDRDGKLKKEHQEIEKLWENICSNLDALCNAHFTPKAPKATITSMSNVAVATLESALPTTKATSTMLAPEEIYAPASSEMRAKSELTPAEKRALRNKQKKTNKKARDALEKSVQKFGRPKGVGDVKRQKEAALKTLVKSGKGVTVVGKKSKEVEGKRGRGKT